MKTPRFAGRFRWSALRQQLLSLREDVESISKIAGRNVTIDEHRGKGKVINVASDASRRGAAAAIGACCYDDGTCDDITEADCAEAGGNWQGEGTTCDDEGVCVGACCEGTTCVGNSTPNSCAADGGTWHDFGTTCDGIDCTQGACCAPDGSCSLTTAEECSGTFQGYGTICDPNPCPPLPLPCCNGCGMLNPDDGVYYLTKEVHYTGTGHCTAFGSEQTSSATMVSRVDIDPVTCEPTYSCSGGGSDTGCTTPDTTTWTWELCSGHCEWSGPASCITANPNHVVWCFGYSGGCPSSELIDATVACSDGVHNEVCDVDHTITVIYSNPCNNDEGCVSPPP